MIPNEAAASSSDFPHPPPIVPYVPLPAPPPTRPALTAMAYCPAVPSPTVCRPPPPPLVPYGHLPPPSTAHPQVKAMAYFTSQPPLLPHRYRMDLAASHLPFQLTPAVLGLNGHFMRFNSAQEVLPGLVPFDLGGRSWFEGPSTDTGVQGWMRPINQMIRVPSTGSSCLFSVNMYF